MAVASRPSRRRSTRFDRWIAGRMSSPASARRKIETRLSAFGSGETTPHAPTASAPAARSGPCSTVTPITRMRSATSRTWRTMSMPLPSGRSRSTSTRLIGSRSSASTAAAASATGPTTLTPSPGKPQMSPCASPGPPTTTSTRMSSTIAVPLIASALGCHVLKSPAKSPPGQVDVLHVVARDTDGHDDPSRQSPGRRDQPVPAPARAQPGGLVPVGRRGARRGRRRRTSRSCSRSATPRATGAT